MSPYRNARLATSAWCRPALVLLTLLATLQVGSARAAADGAATTSEMDPVTPLEFNGDVRDLPLFSRPPAAPRRPSLRPLRTPPPTTKPRAPAVEPEVSVPSAPRALMPSPTHNFAGLSFADLCGGVRCGAGWPPDTNGDVGLNHYIQAVNDAYAIYSKTGTLLASFTEDQLWSTGGTNPCNGNSFGDPVVLYDQLADRWILTHFAFAESSGGDPVSPFYQCLAVSKTSDPVSGGWWLYPLRMDPGGTDKPPLGALNDYAKFGIWPDCLYMAANEFQFPAGNFVGTAFASFSRSDLYSGAALTWSLGFINSAPDPFTMIPSNVLGKSAAALPLPGTPNYFVSESQTAFAFEVRKFTAGPNCGAGGTLGAATIVSQADYPFPLANIPQPGTSNMLDSIDDRLMQKVQYRKVGVAESLWVVHNAQTSSTVTLQWAQLDVTGGVILPTPVQQQIYAPDTTLHRWMGSLAVDRQGNMALGFSTSNGSSPNFPSVAYSGRLATDPLNTLPQSEVQLVAGAGSQTNNCGGAPCSRWGDYTAMSVDPADDCTFWYTNEYYSSAANGASGNWQTRIGAFKFPSCVGSTPSTTTTVASSVNPAVAGQAVTFTATVSVVAPGGGTPTGTVTFFDGATSLGPGTLTAAAQATLTTSTLAVGTHAVTAQYAGDASFSGSTSAALSQTVRMFADVPATNLFFTWIEALAAAGITGGCAKNPPQYCPADGVTRGQMAVFLLRGIHGAGYDPPAATGTMFTDVPATHLFAKWIEQLGREGITAGCATSPPQYCPDAGVMRGQMAVFLLRAEHGAGYDPPAATGTMFTDVPMAHPFAKWIEQLGREGITGGCGSTTYCPDAAVTRAQMAVFLVRTFKLPM